MPPWKEVIPLSLEDLAAFITATAALISAFAALIAAVAQFKSSRPKFYNSYKNKSIKGCKKMAVCQYCGREMTKAKACVLVPVVHKGEKYKPVKFGQEEDDWGLERYPDSVVKKDGYHHPGCDIERCPVCGRQLISCGCVDSSDDDEKANEQVINSKSAAAKTNIIVYFDRVIGEHEIPQVALISGRKPPEELVHEYFSDFFVYGTKCEEKAGCYYSRDGAEAVIING